MMVMFIYWIFLHKDALNYFKIDGVSKFLPINIYTGRVIYLYTVHTIPALACLSNVLITNCLMKINLFLIIFSIGGIFGIVSYIFSMKTGIVLYWFLDPKLGLIIFSFNITVIVLLAYLAYYLACRLERIFKPKLGIRRAKKG